MDLSVSSQIKHLLVKLKVTHIGTKEQRGFNFKMFIFTCDEQEQLIMVEQKYKINAVFFSLIFDSYGYFPNLKLMWHARMIDFYSWKKIDEI